MPTKSPLPAPGITLWGNRWSCNEVTRVPLSGQHVHGDVWGTSAQDRCKPTGIWRCYVDELFCVKKITVVEGFLSHLNSLCLTITFTMEQEVDGKLVSLDTLLRHKNNGSLNVSFYRKPTQSTPKTTPCERWRNLLSLHRAQTITITQGENTRAKEHHLRKVLKRMDTPKHSSKWPASPTPWRNH